MTRYSPPFVLAFCASVVISGCQGAKTNDSDDAREGTYVGNPGEMRARLAPIGDAELDNSVMEVGGIGFVNCDGTEDEWVAVDGLYDLNSNLYIAIPPGTWCHTSMELFNIHLSGVSGLTGGTFEMFLEPGNINMDTYNPMEFVDGTFVMEFGEPGWTSAQEIDVAQDDHVIIDHNHDFFEEFGNRVNEGTGLYNDDGDGWVSDDERELEAVAEVTPHDPVGDDDDDEGDTDEPTDLKQCGCSSTTSGSVALWTLGLLLIGWRNRRC